MRKISVMIAKALMCVVFLVSMKTMAKAHNGEGNQPNGKGFPSALACSDAICMTFTRDASNSSNW